MRKFKVGDLVRLSDGGMDKWPDSNVNPHKDVGIVSDIGVKSMFGLNVEVDWGGSKNSYAPSHLESIAPANSLTPGQTYTTASGRKCRIIYVEDGFAYGFHLHEDGSHGKSAYCWDMCGEYQNAVDDERAPYNIVFEPVRETVTRHVTWIEHLHEDGQFYSGHGGYNYDYAVPLNITFDLIDGTPDWSTAKVTPCD